MTRPEGLLTVTGIKLDSGKDISTQQAVDYGWIANPVGRQPAGWGLEKHEICLGKNLFVDNGRQHMVYSLFNRTPVSDFVCSRYGVGTGTTPARVTDVALEAAIQLVSATPTLHTTKAIDTVNFLSAYTVRVSFTIALSDANNCIISEMGLFSGNDSLIARKVRTVSIVKKDTFSPTLSWRLRF